LQRVHATILILAESFFKSDHICLLGDQFVLLDPDLLLLYLLKVIQELFQVVLDVAQKAPDRVFGGGYFFLLLSGVFILVMFPGVGALGD
jgi:hypothetical protein